ncbi:hypothetical protein KIN20_013595 [Parelaphostrongylus tenuis]|uniref:Uncharacterized protein n=1 Tax=Parelaphostrongylus tenuis TaxID=148309 RepID=A0AAD5QB90_PARTN|nr:hypothetical protein KIN20_000115 [Parelaphostrongylus tenuis]KAJ1355989.1 hypothetical protein KIN20_013595 [Parelaphostrongylus tenuis]
MKPAPSASNHSAIAHTIRCYKSQGYESPIKNMETEFSIYKPCETNPLSEIVVIVVCMKNCLDNPNSYMIFQDFIGDVLASAHVGMALAAK